MGAAIHWDLLENATRGRIRDITFDLLDDETRRSVQDAVENCGVTDRHHHDVAEVDAAIDAARVSDRVKADAHAVYRILAQAEASVHGCTVEQTHFHEVGNGEAVRNVLAICLALEALDPVEITATCVQTGSGKVVCAHGELGIPAPATAAIIARGIPICETRLEGELCTPTSAAVILHFVDRFE